MTFQIRRKYASVLPFETVKSGDVAERMLDRDAGNENRIPPTVQEGRRARYPIGAAASGGPRARGFSASDSGPQRTQSPDTIRGIVELPLSVQLKFQQASGAQGCDAEIHSGQQDPMWYASVGGSLARGRDRHQLGCRSEHEPAHGERPEDTTGAG